MKSTRVRACAVSIVASAVLGACGFDAMGTATPRDSNLNDAASSSLDDATIIDASTDEARDGTGVLDASLDRNADVNADAQRDADASCKAIGSTCGSAGDCCSLSCEDDNGTLRCQ